jgi:hypothetical protein
MVMIVFAAAALLAIALGSAALLKGWRGWLELKRLQLSGPNAAPPSEVRQLRERVRKLERIAIGLD